MAVVVLPQATDKHGLTPLICACLENHVAGVKLLLEKVGAEWCRWFHRSDEPRRRTKGPLTLLCGGGGGDGMSTERAAAPPPLLLLTGFCVLRPRLRQRPPGLLWNPPRR